MIQLAVAGASGRMGRCVVDLASRDERFTVVAALTFRDDPEIGTVLRYGEIEVSMADRIGAPCEALVDFSTPVGTIEWLKVCERLEIPMVTGVTGHDAEQLRLLREGGRVIPILAAPNFSIGMLAVVDAVGRLAQQLGPDYDIEVVEAHHRQKVDAPSGSAMSLVKRIAEAAGRDETGADVVYGRHGAVGERPRGQIGVHALRMGEVVGQHEVHFSGAGETVTIRHTVQSRETFAAGALRAAGWVVEQPPGFYSIEDLIRTSPPAS